MDESNEEHWDGDVNAAAREQWTEESTAFERIRSTVDVTTEPQTASEIAERAAVSEPTARKYLTTLADGGHVKQVESENGYKYMRSPQTIATRRVAAIHRQHTKAELQSSIQELQTELSDLEETYEVTDVDALVTDVDDDTRWPDVARWRQIEENLKIARAALHLFDFDPDDSRQLAEDMSDEEDGANESGARGALGTESSGQAA